MKNWPIFSIPSRNRNALLFAVMSAAVLLAALLSISMGAVSISPWSVLRALVDRNTDTVETRIILYSRLPRTLGCLLVGMSLALSGAVIQSVMNNPLAAPNIIGVNSGAGCGIMEYLGATSDSNDPLRRFPWRAGRNPFGTSHRTAHRRKQNHLDTGRRRSIQYFQCRD